MSEAKKRFPRILLVADADGPIIVSIYELAGLRTEKGKKIVESATYVLKECRTGKKISESSNLRRAPSRARTVKPSPRKKDRRS
jgi:hypothetical protein